MRRFYFRPRLVAVSETDDLSERSRRRQSERAVSLDSDETTALVYRVLTRRRDHSSAQQLDEREREEEPEVV